jgi:hypothetical protein
VVGDANTRRDEHAGHDKRPKRLDATTPVRVAFIHGLSRNVYGPQSNNVKSEITCAVRSLSDHGAVIPRMGQTAKNKQCKKQTK